MSDEAQEPVSMDILPFEVQAMILRYAVTEILKNIRRTDTLLSYAARLQPWINLRLTSRTFYNVLKQLLVDGVPLTTLLKSKQLERLDYGLEAIRLTADGGTVNSRLSVLKLRRAYGRFWYNSDLSASTIASVFQSLASPQSLNFAVKLESWIEQHRQRSVGTSHSNDSILVFEPGDWVIDAGDLQIKRVTRWQSAVASKTSRISMYLSNEYRLPVDSVHERLGHERRWYIEVLNDMGNVVVKCMVNYESKMVWDHLGRRLFNFEGHQLILPHGADEDREEAEDDDDETEMDEDEDDE
jgi:hypothetical protein